jgi:CheY-like chemotaxis protein
MVREAVRAENLPLELQIVTDGERAIEFITRAEQDPNAPPLDAVLLDLNLPKIDGFEVLSRIRRSEKYKRIPVVVFTSSDAPMDRRKAAEFGAGYFRKPPSYDEFLKLGGVLKQVLQDSGSL